MRRLATVFSCKYNENIDKNRTRSLRNFSLCASFIRAEGLMPRRSEASSGSGDSAQRFALYVLIKRLQSAFIPFVMTRSVGVAD